MMKWLILAMIWLTIPTMVAAREPGKLWDPLIVEQLPNGLTVVIKENRAMPLVVSDVWFRVGSRFETDANNGAAHFLEHLLFKGTTTRGVGEIAREIESFGGRTNAGTANDFTHYYISCESRHLDRAMAIQADVFRNSTLDPDAVAKERGVVVEEIRRSRDDPRRVLWDSLIETTYTRHPYRRTVLGPESNIASGISRDALKDFFKTWYVPANMTLIVVGDVDPPAVIAKAKELYGDIPATAVPMVSPEPEPELVAPRIARRHLDVKRGYVYHAWRTVPTAQEEETVGLDMLAAVLGHGRSSRLVKTLKEERGLVTSIGCSHVSLLDDGLLIVSAEFEPADEEAVMAAINGEIRRVLNEQVSDAELDKAKDLIATAYLRASESNEGKSSILGSAMVKASLDFERNYLDRLLAITPSQLQLLANKFLARNNTVSVFVGPKPRFVESTVAESAGVRRFGLANGLRIVHLQQPGSGLAGISLAIDAGSLREESGAAGLANLTAQMILKGTEKRTAEQINWDLESLGANIGVSVEPDLLRINLSAPANRLRPVLAILAEIVQQPAFPDEPFAIERNKVLGQLRGLNDSMFDSAWKLFHESLFPGHPYAHFSIGDPEVVRTLDRGSLQAFHAATFRPERMVLAVCGDTAASATVSLVDLYFGRWSGKRSEPAAAPGMTATAAHPGATDTAATAADAVAEAARVAGAGSGSGAGLLPHPLPRPVERPVEARYRKDSQQAMICMGWLCPAVGAPDYPAMKVLNTVLGGGMSSRLFDRIRNQQSLAYVAQSYFPTRLAGGPLVAVVGTTPAQAAQVRSSVLAETARIAAEGVTDEELERAKAYLVGQFLMDRETVAARAQYLSWFELLGIGYRYELEYPEQIRAVTSAQVREIASKYLAPDRVVVAITGPE